MLPREVAATIVANLKRLYPEPVSCHAVRTGFSRTGMYCIAGSLAMACSLQNLYGGRFPGPEQLDQLLLQLGVSVSIPRKAGSITYLNDILAFDAAYKILEELLAQADQDKLRKAVPHELWPRVTLDEVIDATEARRQRQEVMVELVTVQAVR